MPAIETLVSDIENLFSGHECSDKMLDDFCATLKNQIKHSFQSYGEERRGTLRMSNIGKPCGRYLWYEVKGYKGEPLTPAAKFKFMYGHILESLLIYLAKEAGHDVQDEQKQVQVEGIRGSIDCIIDGVLVDVKSASTRSFSKFKDGTLGGQDSFGYLPQISGYLGGLAGSTTRAAFLAVDKTLGHICLYEPESLPEASEIIAKARVAVNSETPPERISGALVDEGKSGNKKLSVGCSYCQFKQDCWKDSNNGKGLRCFLYSTGPTWFAEVANEPRVQEIK
jgi:hypothetical protein